MGSGSRGTVEEYSWEQGRWRVPCSHSLCSPQVTVLPQEVAGLQLPRDLRLAPVVLPWLSGQPGEVSQLGDGDDGSVSYISPVSYHTGVSHATQTIPS